MRLPLMRLPLPTLRANLIAAFVAVIALSLLLASGAFAYLLREYQANLERDRLERTAVSYTMRVSQQVRAGQPLSAIALQLDEATSTSESGVRVLLLDDRGLVLHDTDANRFVGRTLPLPMNPGRRPNVFQGMLDMPSGSAVITVSYPFANLREQQPGFKVAVIAPAQTLTSAWGEVLPRLSIAALMALLVSIGIAWWLASTITRPLVQITRASEEMAHGNLDPHLTLPETTDEVGRMSKAFTIMAREVARSHRAMRDLLANVSHDLRTPLTSISGFAGALVDGTLSGPEGAREAGRVIGEEAERMRRLVEDLLYLGQIESGNVSLQRDPMDLAELARAAQARFQFRAQESGIKLEVDASQPATILGDPHRIGQVLDNLIENAIKHTPPTGFVHVTVHIQDSKPGVNGSTGTRPSRPRRSAVLTVHNTGSFIAPEEAERVFERFYQMDKARAGSAGSGLGLAIAREIVQAHRGHIDLRSTPHTGTSFIVRIPILEASEVPTLTSAEPMRSAEVGAHR
jgi:signal transduction histidine kinase